MKSDGLQDADSVNPCELLHEIRQHTCLVGSGQRISVLIESIDI